MIFLHEVHEVVGGRMGDFEGSVRTRWKPLVEVDGADRLAGGDVAAQTE
jgi:hypothetical protein